MNGLELQGEDEPINTYQYMSEIGEVIETKFGGYAFHFNHNDLLRFIDFGQGEITKRYPGICKKGRVNGSFRYSVREHDILMSFDVYAARVNSLCEGIVVLNIYEFANREEISDSEVKEIEASFKSPEGIEKMIKEFDH